MGIKPLRSLSSARIFSVNNALSANITERSQIMRYSDLIQQSQNLSIPEQIVFRSEENLHQTHIIRQRIQCSSADEFDNLNQYIFFLKNNVSNMDLTNLYTPFQIRQHTRGFCQQVEQAQYGLSSQLQARQNRNENFHESQIWYLVISVLNGIRQFQRIKCISGDFSIQSIKFNNQGCVKISNAMQSPRKFEVFRNERFYWGQKNLINYFVQQTYRFGLVLLQLCSMSPISLIIQQSKRKTQPIFMEQTFGNNPQYQISKALQIVKQHYSQLLNNLINIMLCHPRDRPLPSQIYQVLNPYKADILQFKPFNFNAQTAQMIKSNLNTSNYTRKQSFSYDKQDNLNISNNLNSQYNSIQLPQRNMYSSLNINDNKNSKNSLYAYQQYTQVKQQQQQPQMNNLSVLHMNNLQHMPAYKNSLIYNLHNEESININNNTNNKNMGSINYSILDNNSANNSNVMNNRNTRTNTTNIQFNRTRQRNGKYINTKNQVSVIDNRANMNANMNANTNVNVNVNANSSKNRNYSISSRNDNLQYGRSKTIDKGNRSNNNQGIINNEGRNKNIQNNQNNSFISYNNKNNLSVINQEWTVKNRPIQSYSSQQSFNHYTPIQHQVNPTQRQPQNPPQNRNNNYVQSAQQNLRAIGKVAQSSVYNPHEDMNAGKRSSYVANPVGINQYPASLQVPPPYQQYRAARSPTQYLSR